MSNTIQSPYMKLQIPVAGIDPGPDYANNVNSALLTIDSHNHSTGYGFQITPSGLSISSDLPFLGNNATQLRSTRFLAQASPLSTSADYLSVSVSGVDLYYLDGNGNSVRITSGGNVNAGAGSITGLASPASATYVSATPAFVFQSASLTAANLDGGSITLRPLVASAPGVTLSAPSGLVSSYTMTLPSANPSGTSFITLSSAGAIGATISTSGGITGSMITSNVSLSGNVSVSGTLSVGSGPFVITGIDAQDIQIGSGTTVALRFGSFLAISALGSGNSNTFYRTYNNTAPRLPIPTSGTDLGLPTHIIWGTVNANGSIASGDGFTVSQSGTGVYVVTLSSAYSEQLSVTATVVDGNIGLVAQITSLGSGSFTVTTFSVVTASPSNRAFNFIANGYISY